MLVAASALAVQGSLHAQTRAVDPELKKLVESARQDLDAYWRRQLKAYIPPTEFVLMRAPAINDCGRMDQPTVQYCAASHTIYWDDTLLGFLNSTIGDFAPVVLLAHEWSLLAQKLMGLDQPSRNTPRLVLELQADCHAGNWALDAGKRGLLDKDDLGEALAVLQLDLDAPIFDVATHGAGQARTQIFLYGYQGRDCRGDGFRALLREHKIDSTGRTPAATPAPAVPETMYPKQVGPYTQSRVEPAKTSFGLVGVSTTYESGGGSFVVHLVSAARSADEATMYLDRSVGESKTDGYTQVTRLAVVHQGTRLGTVVRMRGTEDERVLWSNRQYFGIIQGERAWEFYTAAALSR